MTEFHEQAVRNVASIDGDNYVNNLIEYAVSQRERVLELANGIVEEYSPCDFDEARPSLEYCRTHTTKHCGQAALFEKAQAALAEPEREKGK